MKSLRALKAAGLILAAVVLGLMTVQGSLALWNKAVPSNAGTIQSANFSILVNKAEMPSTPISFATGELGRGKAVYKTLDITNNVNVAPNSPLLVQAGLTGLGAVNGFDGYLTVKAAAAPVGTDCSTLNTALYSTTPAIPALAVNKSQTICLQVLLDPATPAAYPAKPINSTVAITVAQIAPQTK